MIGSPASRRRLDRLRRQLRQPGLLLRRRRRVDARVVRRAELRRELTIVLARILARARGDLGGEEIHDETVLVGGPDGAVVTEEARPRALLAAEAARSVEQPGDEPLEAHRYLEQPAAEALHDAIDHAAADQRLADRGMGRPAWPVRQQIPDGHGEVVIGIHEPRGARHDAMSVCVAVVGEGDPKPIFQFDESCHGMGARWVHADLAVVIDGHEREGRIDHRVHDGDVELVDRVDRLPVRLAGAPERIHAEREAGAPDGRHVDDVLQIPDIGQDEVVLVRAGGRDGLRVWQPSHPDVAVAQERVGPFLDPRRHVGVGRAAVRRVVLEAAVLGRVVRRRDDDAVRTMPGCDRGCTRESRAR